MVIFHILGSCWPGVTSETSPLALWHQLRHRATPRDPSARPCTPPWDRPARPRRASSLGRWGEKNPKKNPGKTHRKNDGLYPWENPWGKNHGTGSDMVFVHENWWIWHDVTAGFLGWKFPTGSDRGTANELEENDAQRPQVHLRQMDMELLGAVPISIKGKQNRETRANNQFMQGHPSLSCLLVCKPH